MYCFKVPVIMNLVILTGLKIYIILINVMETLNLKTLGRVVQYSTLIFSCVIDAEEDIYANFVSHKYNILERYGNNECKICLWFSIK